MFFLCVKVIEYIIERSFFKNYLGKVQRIFSKFRYLSIKFGRTYDLWGGNVVPGAILPSSFITKIRYD